MIREGAFLFNGLPLLLGTVVVSAGALAQDMKSVTDERCKKATVLVFTAESKNAKGDTPLGSGSGFFINGTGLVVTNNHVIDPTHQMIFDRERQAWYYQHGTLTYTVVVDAGTDQEQTFECTKIYQNRTADQALLQAKTSEGRLLSTPNYLRLLPESRLKPEMLTWAMGFPGGDRQREASSGEKHPRVTVTKGKVLEVQRSPGGRIKKIFTDTVANRGNSGGPMVDIDGFLIGAVTLKSKPEDREDTGGANYSALSPAKITREMVQNAYLLKKIPDGTDFTPFIDLLTNDEGRIDIPEFRREKEKDVLFFPTGDRLHGVVATDKVVWDSPIGKVEVPTEAVAYMMKADSGASLFLEGGNRIAATQAEQKFRFKPDDGAEVEFGLDTVSVAGFKTAGRRISPIDGKVIVFDSDLSHLVLSEVTGQSKFKGANATIQVSIEDIYRVDKAPDGDDQVLVLVDGQRLTGKFLEDPYTGKIAATGTPIVFNLSKVTQATVEIMRLRGDALAGLDLVGIMASANADRDVVRVARFLEYGDIKMARLRLSELTGNNQLKALPAVKREQVALLDGVCSLREGQYEQAKKLLKASNKAGNENISAYASACSEVLKKFDTQYEGKPLSDRATFIAAGTELADDAIQKVRDVVKDLRRLSFDKKADYPLALNAVKKYEDDMPRASVFAGTNADDEMLRLWKLATDASEKEIGRLDSLIQERQGGERGAAGRRDNPAKRQREIEDLQKEREETVETFEKYIGKQFEYGFRVEDPDIHAMKLNKSERGKSKDDDEGP